MICADIDGDGSEEVLVASPSAALVIDHFGLFGATVIPISTPRVIGVLLLAAGVMLIRWT